MKRKLIAIFAVILFFGVLEGLCSLWIKSYGNSLDKSRSVVEPDTTLGWRHKKNLSTNFMEKAFTTNEHGFRVVPQTNGKRVLFLGPSSTVGWGVSDDESYAAILAREFQVINAAQIGHTSFQGLRLYRDEFKNQKFDYVIVAFGINDVDMNRFYFQSALPDAEELKDKKSEGIVNAQKFIFSSSLLLCMHKLAFSMLSAVVPKPSPEKLKEFIRVREDEFRSNFTDIVQLARENGAKPIILSTATHFIQNQDKDIQFRQDLIQERMKHYRDVLNAVALRENIAIADPEGWLPEKRDHLFVDPVHYSVEGNKLIAQKLREIIAQ